MIAPLLFNHRYLVLANRHMVSCVQLHLMKGAETGAGSSRGSGVGGAAGTVDPGGKGGLEGTLARAIVLSVCTVSASVEVRAGVRTGLCCVCVCVSWCVLVEVIEFVYIRLRTCMSLLSLVSLSMPPFAWHVGCMPPGHVDPSLVRPASVYLSRVKPLLWYSWTFWLQTLSRVG